MWHCYTLLHEVSHWAFSTNLYSVFNPPSDPISQLNNWGWRTFVTLLRSKSQRKGPGLEKSSLTYAAQWNQDMVNFTPHSYRAKRTVNKVCRIIAQGRQLQLEQVHRRMCMPGIFRAIVTSSHILQFCINIKLCEAKIIIFGISWVQIQTLRFINMEPLEVTTPHKLFINV